MVLDLITLGILLLAMVKGLSKGLLVAVFSMVALVIGLAAALKLSAITAFWLEGSVNISSKWLPLVAFLLVFIIVVILVNRIALLMEKTIEWAFLGWINKAGGILFFGILYLLIWSVILFYLVKMHIITDQLMEKSVTYAVIAPFGPATMNWIAELIPVFKHVFDDIGHFFEQLSSGIKP
ncbi:CvpA family protein [Flavihumibacter profundi]|uniref:CvpA family protein n=1 Tax=Flavihumibacter profundi TaxID=2716883 RepID=UPI001CC3FEA9|nr:CvpA family protein [Flavihumibacter profundi]MBZ5857869.1 CvpA family protein [Flavihumibacter profundi]